MIDHRQLQALRAVHSEGSITRAAKFLGWSQPTVDHHLKNLDLLVGAPVLQRTHRGSSITAVGALLLERGQQLLTLNERALRDARELTRTGRVRLRFGMFPTVAGLLHSIMTRLREIDIEIDAVFQEVPQLISRLGRYELDAAIVYSAPGHRLPLQADVVTLEVLRDPLMLVLPEDHPLASRASIDRASLLTLSGERWVFAATWDDPMDATIIEAFAQAGHELDITIRTDDFRVMLGVVAAGMAVSFIPKLASGPSSPGVVMIPIDEPSFARSVLLAVPDEGRLRQLDMPARQLAMAVREALDALE